MDRYLVENKSNKLKLEALKSGSHRIDKAEMDQVKAKHNNYFRKKKELKRLVSDVFFLVHGCRKLDDRELVEKPRRADGAAGNGGR